ncbi:ABC-type sugar transport system ATPase subunit [Aequitasia blattaphilus]|uniref:Sugar ABC transporter ATP-binding protein n=1 Tax=Aequitasia blattaphilus TaxID=2949332 RepID=A0ABT1EAK8_9FIRM|nr:sugar ABC transporter ATP-binding protein [Aequitasia blattaphilus]MCP1102654.1 sugar ABC transporter ATP-binding protein [Aequitasia blattaphilus]MCR8615294.1 sugar ABC transporter ATP-binding protein [Aequitasia blattaphilus]
MSNSDYILEMNNICKSFPGVIALDNVTFKVEKGEVHCLIGANGAGKSTLMKILSSAYTEDSGEIYFDSKLLKAHGTQKRREEGIAVIYQELSLFNELTVGENVYINNYPKTKTGGIDWKKVYRDTQDLADKLNIKIDAKAPVHSLNIGQRQLTEIMKALACNAKLIVMDEPSSTLSQSEFEILVKVIEDLKNHGITIIYISHHLEELFIVGDHITVLRDGKFVACKKTCDLDEDRLVEYMTGIDLSQIESEEKTIHPVSDEVVLELKDLSNDVVKDINLKLHKGEVLGLYGLVGSGRTEILQSIFGVRSTTNGKILLNGKEIVIKDTGHAIRNKIGLAPENRKAQGLVLPLPVWENMSMVSLPKFLKKGKIDYKSITTICESHKDKLNVKTPSINTVTQNLSGGNQQKVILAKWLMQDCDILLLDEPTQGIDVMAKEEIYKLIHEITTQGKSVIVVSSELQELLRICDNIHVMYDGKQIFESNKGSFNQEQILHASVIGRAI